MRIQALVDKDFRKRRAVIEPLGFVQDADAKFVWNKEVTTVDEIKTIEQVLKGKIPYRKEL